MSETNENTENNQPQTETLKKFDVLASQVKETIKDNNYRVFDKVVEVLVDQELTKRRDIVIKGLEALKCARNELNKVQPDIVSYGLDGKAIGSPAFSKTKIEERKKTLEKVNNLEGALEKALTEGVFDKLTNLVGQNKPEQKTDPKPENKVD